MQIREWASTERQKDGAAGQIRRRRLANASLQNVANFKCGNCCTRKYLNSMPACTASRSKIQRRSNNNQMGGLPMEMVCLLNVRVPQMDILSKCHCPFCNGMGFVIVLYRTPQRSLIGAYSPGQKLPKIHFGEARALVSAAQRTKKKTKLQSDTCFCQNC